MKWFKHYTDSLSDPFIEELMDKYSHAGYVAWFGLIEIICKENGRELTGKLEIYPTYLKRKLRISSTKLQQIFDFCQTNGKLLFDFSQEKWSFDFPKVAEIKDNYTKDLQVASKKPSKHKEKEKEEEKDIKNKKNKLIGFDDFWKTYPKKKSKGQAEKTWDKISPANDLLKTMLDAIEKAKRSEDWTKENGKYIPFPSTWLNAKGWEDEIIEPKDYEVRIGDEVILLTETEYQEWNKANGR